MFSVPPKVRCSVSGHRWRQILYGLRKGAPLMECTRCGEVGWLV